MTHDDLKTLAERPAFNRTQRAELLEIAEQLKDDWVAVQTEYDELSDHPAGDADAPDRVLCSEFNALLTRARAAIKAEAFPRAMLYLKAAEALADEAAAAKQSRTAAD